MHPSLERFRIDAIQLRELWNYYKIGVVNTVFGLSLYAILIFIGLNLFVSQFVGQCVGVVFNYYMFRTHVFTQASPSKFRYIFAYVFNYFLGLGALYVLHRLISSAYLAGFGSAMFVAAVNYFVLKFLVFNRRPVDIDG